MTRLHRSIISAWTDQLSFIKRREFEASSFLRFFLNGDFNKLVEQIKGSFGFEFESHIDYNSNITNDNCMAQVAMPMSVYLSGPPLKGISIDFKIRSILLEQQNFHTFVICIAHEMSHVLLNSIYHPLREEETAVDICAMLVGYDDFLVNGNIVRDRNGNNIYSLGELDQEEMLFIQSEIKSRKIQNHSTYAT